MLGDETYPVNVARTETFGHVLESYRKQLASNAIFHARYRSLVCIDLYEQSDAFQPVAKLDTLDKLSKVIDEEDGAPLWRLVSLQSASSRGALCCSREQLTFLLTYYQVMPSFLDFVLMFKNRARPLLRALFRHESYLDRDSPQLDPVDPRRSGMQIQHAFNLLSVERATDSHERNPWPLRQFALYHSFDISSGRTLWIFLKGNQMMARRFLDATKTHRLLKPSVITTPEASFVATLQVQTMVMDWCAESWGEYIEYLEDKLSAISVDAKVASVEDMTSKAAMDHNFSRRGTLASVVHRGSSLGPQSQTSSPRSPPASPGRPFQRSPSGFATAIRRMSGLIRQQSGGFADEKAGTLECGLGPAEDEASDTDEAQHLEDLDKKFAFKNFQQLNFLGDDVGQALAAIDQNKGVLQEIEEQYRAVITSHAFTTHIKIESCEGDLSAFFRRTRSLSRDLGIHHGRLSALSRGLENDKVTLTALLQYKSERTSRYFADAAKMSSEKMEDWTEKMHTIAVRTEQETLSMHVITIFTLIFLPGTFISTFFSSGVLHWDDTGTMESDWVVRPRGLSLFMSISFPMMAIILTSWIILNLYMNQRRRQKLREVRADVESNSGLGLEGLERGKAAALGPSSNALLATPPGRAGDSWQQSLTSISGGQGRSDPQSPA